jgi:hypothetical protein
VHILLTLFCSDFLTEWLFVVNFLEIPPQKLACWRSLLREAGGEKVNHTQGMIFSKITHLINLRGAFYHSPAIFISKGLHCN